MASNSRLLLLRRGDHDSRLTEGFESLLDTESMCDVSITCGQYIVRAHRTVLSIFSPFFKRIFDSINNPLHYPFVVIKDMPYADLRAIIDLMYRGEVTVAQDQFGSLKKSAKTLEVSELSDIITSYEEKMDTKPKINFEDSITSSGRNTRKRGRPKRYCEESDEELKFLQTPNKRQQIIQSRQSVQPQIVQKPQNKASNIVKKPFVQKTAIRYVEETSVTPKPQTATRGGHYSFSKQPTAIRGSHSAFTRPQTATRGGHSVGLAKQQIATRGHPKMASRGARGGRVAVQTNVKTIGESFASQDTSVRRGRRGRPPRQSRDSESDLPLATSLPVSLPEPVEVDLGNIFPNYNLNDVTSSTSNTNVSIPVTFETTIKREQDSDSEVECIMSGSSPLPSGVVEDSGEAAQLQTSYNNEVSTNTSLQPIEIPANNELTNDNINELTVRERDTTQESAINDTINSSIVFETESSGFQSNIIIKTERNVSPLNETHESTISSIAIDSNIDSMSSDITPATTLISSQSDCRTDPTTALNTPTIISLNTDSRESINSGPNVPIIRFIKTERISPPVIETSFQSIAFSSQGTDNNIIDSNQTSNTELEVTNETSVPLMRRIKIERLSPTTVCNTVNISEVNQNVEESSVVTSSRNNESSVEMSANANSNQLVEDTNEIECLFYENPPLMSSVKVERKSPTQELNQTVAETNSDQIECSSSGQHLSSENSGDIQITEGRNDDNLIDVQEIAFDCFFNEEQQMQTLISSEATTSSIITTSEVNNSFLQINNLQDINTIHQNHQLINQEREQQQEVNVNIQESYLNNEMSAGNTLGVSTTEANVNQASSLTNSYSIDNDINSPIRSDEECMLLNSPQQAGYEVTVGSNPNLGEDSINENI